MNKLLKCFSELKPKGFLLIIFFGFGVFTAFGQEIIVSGVITGIDGQPIPGVSVIVKDTKTGTTSDFDGNYTVQASQSDVLVFSYIGYATQEVDVNQNTINVVLQEDIAALDEVVVVGFGTQKKVNLTGAVGVVNSEELEGRAVQNASQMLQGMVPG